MPMHSILPSLLLAIILSAPAMALAQQTSQGPQPTGPVVHEDFCPG
ncbi:hypothetical protein [Thioalkalivibrio denitrificans]|nr:hypothetical protein [Thioalkalivibrio denitrificans]